MLALLKTCIPYTVIVAQISAGSLVLSPSYNHPGIRLYFVHAPYITYRTDKWDKNVSAADDCSRDSGD